jgi:thienamycin biosynthesis protein ThnN
MPVLTEQMSARLNEGLEDRLRRVVDCHFDPDGGSRFWLDRQERLGIDARADVRSLPDLAILGEMTSDDLSQRPLRDYVPRRFHRHLGRFVLGQTGGTTGQGIWTAYRQDEFYEAFVLPFVTAARRLGFPARQNWLYVGPSGPHIIGKAARHLATAMGSADPFSVDFDSRWAKHLPEGSFVARRYLQHVVDQAVDVIRHQSIGVLFTTPAVLAALAEAMRPEQRDRVRGVHYGGQAISPGQMQYLQERAFPNAVHVSGYGNTLFGCCLELNVAIGRQLDYYPQGSRLHLEITDEQGASLGVGHTGQVRFTRLDESTLIVRFRERDRATLIAAPADRPEGFGLPGVRNPHTAWNPGVRPAEGLY